MNSLCDETLYNNKKKRNKASNSNNFLGWTELVNNEHT